MEYPSEHYCSTELPFSYSWGRISHCFFDFLTRNGKSIACRNRFRVVGARLSLRSSRMYSIRLADTSSTIAWRMGFHVTRQLFPDSTSVFRRSISDFNASSIREIAALISDSKFRSSRSSSTLASNTHIVILQNKITQSVLITLGCIMVRIYG